ncbi:general transcription factor 3C polypeptide 2 [Notolabrus celidotus]|uniref:general transcription factor 3C polypeptide 2 n=1 Tax=Notolabrus celidotus TaxID=1203425 RepID=UPI00148FD980|nr:general transcription factor 3C polypeptide 2 [Notolabrus celidotus]XP_034555360.1 general transcription factor 3C polypeptide 2 [Notolabrus celidotus]XP_034555361.1 general transcription factor 3C polypeptide 2 [Notolabrus celidotus]XP_034555362.1 general transcription factor 3C polypeptide 2 [Notolabrus celidotus]XP_034555363.1 general transcription factor 3C polypeptide 2 [Notolabrus celidotus]
MDPSDSGQGQEKPSEQIPDLTPSSTGRLRKRNPKYLDFETEDTSDVPKKPQRRSSGRVAAAKRTPAKRAKANNDAQETADGEHEANDKTPEESAGITPRKTPKKAGRGRKAKRTPVKRTPAKKAPAPAPDGGLQAEDGGVVAAVQQENGTPKPKRKYVKKQKVEAVVEPPPPCEEKEEPEEEIQPGGRRRRGAAKAALKYLHILAQEVLRHPEDEVAPPSGRNNDDAKTESQTGGAQKGVKGNKGRRGQKRKRLDSEPSDGEEFVPDAKDMDEEEEEEEGEDEDEEYEEEAEDSDAELWMDGRRPATTPVKRPYSCNSTKAPNGLLTNMMTPVWRSAETTKKFREEHHSSWVFPEWIPSDSHWHPVPERDMEKYLPRELQSAAFKVSREGLRQEESPLQRLSRFSALPAHPDRWDMFLFAGGPVWALEWCPTPDGAPASQYIAVSCHRGMDEKHCFSETYTGHGLVQLWGVGTLELSSRPDITPALSYGLAQDKGFIWQLKWCPSGCWEPPDCGRKAPLLPRLGLLAVAASTSVVTIYSLPHPEALRSNRKPANSGKDDQQLQIFQAEAVLTLKLGSFKDPRHERSGQVLSMDWLPEKPHNIMVIGFYDGVVGLWDLSTKTGLLRVREPDASLSLLPYRCFLAHDNAVRALGFCPASRNLLVTAGEDRYVKTWDLRRLDDPITVQKRHLSNEVCWPLNAPGILWAQDNAYAASGSHGVHYSDHNMRTVFAIPRTGTLWSISYSDWLNTLVTADSLGEVILALLPHIYHSPQYLKRTKDRRFPVYLTSMVPYDTATEANPETGGVEDEEGEEEGGETEGLNGSEGGNGNSNENRGGRGRARRNKNPSLCVRKYKEAAKKYFLHLTDNNMLTFTGSEKRAVWKRMSDTEQKAKLNLDEMTLGALHKVRFNPNMLCHTWLVSAGQTGVVRLNCLRSMLSSETKKMMSRSKAKFSTLNSAADQREAVQSETEEL